MALLNQSYAHAGRESQFSVLATMFGRSQHRLQRHTCAGTSVRGGSAANCHALHCDKRQEMLWPLQMQRVCRSVQVQERVLERERQTRAGRASGAACGRRRASGSCVCTLASRLIKQSSLAARCECSCELLRGVQPERLLCLVTGKRTAAARSVGGRQPSGGGRRRSPASRGASSKASERLEKLDQTPQVWPGARNACAASRRAALVPEARRPGGDVNPGGVCSVIRRAAERCGPLRGCAQRTGWRGGLLRRGLQGAPGGLARSN